MIRKPSVDNIGEENEKGCFATLGASGQFTAGCFINTTIADTTTISHVGSNARGTNSGNTITMTTSALPTEGNLLIAVIGLRGSSGVISSVVQTGVQWVQLQTGSSIGTGSSKIQVAIWAGVVSSGAASSITITCTGSTNAAVAEVNENRGLNTEFILNTSPTPC